MIEVSNQSGIPETLDELKARGYPAVEEIFENGQYTVTIQSMRGTANGFPGSRVVSSSLALAQDSAFAEYCKWMDDFRKLIEQPIDPNLFISHETKMITLLTQILDELHKANKRPLYIVVNSQEALQEFMRQIEQVET